MDMLSEEFRRFIITCPSKRILGTVHPFQATVRNKWENPALEHLLQRKSGDVIDGNSLEEAMENARRYIDGLLGSDAPGIVGQNPHLP